MRVLCDMFTRFKIWTKILFLTLLAMYERWLTINYKNNLDIVAKSNEIYIVA